MAHQGQARANSTIQKLKDASVHNWHRFVLAYPDHLVSDLLNLILKRL